jgi:hypothetical protein
MAAPIAKTRRDAAPSPGGARIVRDSLPTSYAAISKLGAFQQPSFVATSPA